MVHWEKPVISRQIHSNDEKKNPISQTVIVNPGTSTGETEDQIGMDKSTFQFVLRRIN